MIEEIKKYHKYLLYEPYIGCYRDEYRHVSRVHNCSLYPEIEKIYNKNNSIYYHVKSDKFYFGKYKRKQIHHPTEFDEVDLSDKHRTIALKHVHNSLKADFNSVIDHTMRNKYFEKIKNEELSKCESFYREQKLKRILK